MRIPAGVRRGTGWSRGPRWRCHCQLLPDQTAAVKVSQYRLGDGARYPGCCICDLPCRRATQLVDGFAIATELGYDPREIDAPLADAVEQRLLIRGEHPETRRVAFRLAPKGQANG